MKTASKPTPRAFTLINLIALLGGLGLTAAVSAPGLGNTRLRNQQAVCAAHLHALGKAATAHALANADQFPKLTGGAWPWDLPTSAVNRLVESGAKRREFYCPSVTISNLSQAWAFTTFATNDPAMPETGFRIAGYQFAFIGAGRVRTTNVTESLQPAPWKVNDILVNPPLNERVIAGDAILSVGDNEQVREANRYSKISGGWAGHQSAHLTGRLPAGGNLLFADGHVNWRRFRDMKVRTDGPPAFWW